MQCNDLFNKKQREIEFALKLASDQSGLADDPQRQLILSCSDIDSIHFANVDAK